MSSLGVIGSMLEQLNARRAALLVRDPPNRDAGAKPDFAALLKRMRARITTSRPEPHVPPAPAAVATLPASCTVCAEPAIADDRLCRGCGEIIESIVGYFVEGQIASRFELVSYLDERFPDATASTVRMALDEAARRGRIVLIKRRGLGDLRYRARSTPAEVADAIMWAFHKIHNRRLGNTFGNVAGDSDVDGSLRVVVKRYPSRRRDAKAEDLGVVHVLAKRGVLDAVTWTQNVEGDQDIRRAVTSAIASLAVDVRVLPPPAALSANTTLEEILRLANEATAAAAPLGAVARVRALEKGLGAILAASRVKSPGMRLSNEAIAGPIGRTVNEAIATSRAPGMDDDASARALENGLASIRVFADRRIEIEPAERERRHVEACRLQAEAVAQGSLHSTAPPEQAALPTTVDEAITLLLGPGGAARGTPRTSKTWVMMSPSRYGHAVELVKRGADAELVTKAINRINASGWMQKPVHLVTEADLVEARRRALAEGAT